MAKKTPARSAKKKAPTKKNVKKSTTKKSPAKKKAPVKKKAVAKKKTPAKPAVKKAAPKKKAPVKKTAKKAAAKKQAATKKAPAKKKLVGKKPAAKKTAPKKSVKTTPKKKTPASKKAAVKKTAAAKKKAVATPPAAEKAAPAKKAVTKAALKSRLGKAKTTKKKTASVGFSLAEVKEIAKKSKAAEKEVAKKKVDDAKKKAAAIEAQLAAAKPAKVAPASLADILGFNPAGGAKASYDDPKAVPAKYRKYYKLLIELRNHLTGQIDQHAEDTLKRSSKDDAGDLSSYGQHMADAGTDTFDRDFALSLVANEQEALAEIEAAIQRIKKGTFGLDEVTGEPIDKDRLTAVPFTRYSAQTQKDLERNRHRVRTQAGLGGEMGDNTVKITDPNSDD